MYLTVYDLSADQMEELKSSFFWQDETQDILENDFTSPDQIPDEIIFGHYDGMIFSEDDFCCSAAY